MARHVEGLHADRARLRKEDTAGSKFLTSFVVSEEEKRT